VHARGGEKRLEMRSLHSSMLATLLHEHVAYIYAQLIRSHTVRIIVSTCRHGRRRTGTTFERSGKGLLLDRGRYIKLPFSQDDAFSLKKKKRVASFVKISKSKFTYLLLKSLGFFLRFEGDEAVAL